MTDMDKTMEKLLANQRQFQALAERSQMLERLIVLFTEQNEAVALLNEILRQAAAFLTMHEDLEGLRALADITDTLFMVSAAQRELVNATKVDAVGDAEYNKTMRSSMRSVAYALMLISDQADALVTAHA